MAAPFSPSSIRALTVSSLRCGRREFAGELQVTLERQGHQTLAFAPELEQFGQGEGADDALAQLGRAIETYYERLSADEEELPSRLADHLRMLRWRLREPTVAIVAPLAGTSGRKMEP